MDKLAKAVHKYRARELWVVCASTVPLTAISISKTLNNSQHLDQSENDEKVNNLSRPNSMFLFSKEFIWWAKLNILYNTTPILFILYLQHYKVLMILKFKHVQSIINNYPYYT